MTPAPPYLPQLDREVRVAHPHTDWVLLLADDNWADLPAISRALAGGWSPGCAPLAARRNVPVVRVIIYVPGILFTACLLILSLHYFSHALPSSAECSAHSAGHCGSHGCPSGASLCRGTPGFVAWSHEFHWSRGVYVFATQVQARWIQMWCFARVHGLFQHLTLIHLQPQNDSPFALFFSAVLHSNN